MFVIQIPRPYVPGYQIAFTRMNREVMYGDGRHVAFERCPTLAAVKRNKYARIVTYEQEGRILVILNDHVDRSHREVA